VKIVKVTVWSVPSEWFVPVNERSLTPCDEFIQSLVFFRMKEYFSVMHATDIGNPGIKQNGIGTITEEGNFGIQNHRKTHGEIWKQIWVISLIKHTCSVP
jgi:hypothetical protein